jgi:hypothetical protein
MKKCSLIFALVLGLSVSLGHPAASPSSGIEEKNPGDIAPVYIYLDFDGDLLFPSITYDTDTSSRGQLDWGLFLFTGLVFGIDNVNDRNQLVEEIINRIKADYYSWVSSGRLIFVTDTTGLDWWYTWGIDARAIIFQNNQPSNIDVDPIDPHMSCPLVANVVCKRLFGKAGCDRSDITDVWGHSIFHPFYCRTFAGSLALDEFSADPSAPPLILGTTLEGRYVVDIGTLANALGNCGSHEIGHLLGLPERYEDKFAKHIMNVPSEIYLACFDEFFETEDEVILNRTLTDATRADDFEPNNNPAAAKVLVSGTYPGLTLHSPFDRDYYVVTTTQDYSGLKMIFDIDKSNKQQLAMHDWCNVSVEYWDGDSTFHFFASPTVTDGGYIFEQFGVPAARHYVFHVYEKYPRRPLNYSITVLYGQGSLAPDRYDIDTDTNNDGIPDVLRDNDTEATASDWTIPKAYSSPFLTIDNPSDEDFYRVNALGSSVRAEMTFEPANGELKLFLNGNEATESSLSADGVKKTLRITGCGQNPSTIYIKGQPNFYSLIVAKIPLQELCSGLPASENWTLFSGNGVFRYKRYSADNPYFPTLIEEDVPVNNRIYGRIIQESAESVTWRLRGSVIFEHLRQRFEGNLVIPAGATTGTFIPVEPDNPYILPGASGLVAWYLTSGFGTGTFTGPHNIISAFSITIPGLQWDPAGHPDNRATLIIEGKVDSDCDFIPDEVELATGTNPFMDDTDGDGLIDGSEDANHNGQLDLGETDPSKWDTDGDGLSDGLELGLTSPEGTDTNMSFFQADADPYVTTDPTSSDTDGDGLLDGEEDSNHNGAVDSGESSPIDPQNNTSAETPAISNGNVTVTFTQVDRKGNTDIIASPSGPETPNFNVCDYYYQITTTAHYEGDIILCFTYRHSQIPGCDAGGCPDREALLEVLHWDGTDWVPATAISRDIENNIICVSVPSLSLFTLVSPVNHPPVVKDWMLTTKENVSLDFNMGGYDEDGDNLTYAIVTPPSHGVLEGAGPDRNYIPDMYLYGSDSFSYKANDGLDDSNIATVSITVKVVYAFTGFKSPIDNPPVVNVAKAGQSVPVKWRITHLDGTPITDPVSFKSVTSYTVACDTLLGDPAAEVEEYSVGSSGLQNLGDGYWQFNWQAPKTYLGKCRTMVLTLADGSTHEASFRFK